MPRKKATKSFVAKDRTYHQIGKRSVSLSLKVKHDSKNSLIYIDDTVDPPKQRQLRYCTNYDTPFVDEQGDNPVIGRINLKDGVLQVPAHEVGLQRFLDVTPENGVIFEEFDPQAKAQEELSREEQLFKAKSYVFNAKVADLKGVAKVIYGSKVNNQTTDEIKQNLIVKCNTNPDLVIELFEDADLSDLILATEALDRNILEVKANKVLNKGDIILEIPFNKDPKEVLKEFFKTKDGTALRKFIKTSL